MKIFEELRKAEEVYESIKEEFEALELEGREFEELEEEEEILEIVTEDLNFEGKELETVYMDNERYINLLNVYEILDSYSDSKETEVIDSLIDYDNNELEIFMNHGKETMYPAVKENAVLRILSTIDKPDAKRLKKKIMEIRYKTK
ncbi:hypothetical protein V7068_21790 [Bacillus sp. JJ634]